MIIGNSGNVVIKKLNMADALEKFDANAYKTNF